MKNNSLILLILTVIAIFMLCTGSASAQDVDIENMDNEQMTTLLQQIMQKLQQEEEPMAETDPEPETSSTAATPVPTADSKMTEEVAKITIYENKKLIIESLPGYMFIQPTQKPKPETNEDKSVCPPGLFLECFSDSSCLCVSPNG